MERPIPVAVVGCGHLGTYHARLWAELPEADLVAVVDIDPARADRLGSELGVPGLSSLESLLGSERGVGAVSVATPTVSHTEVATACLRRGIHVLVEKPIAESVESGRRLVEEARRADRVLAVGHVERFSAVFQAARSELGAPRYIEAHRLAPFVPRSLDVDVVLDLMIHDLDLTLALVPSDVVSVDAAGVPVLTDGADIATARIRFRDGTVANLTASRVSREKVRKIRFFGKGRYHSLDLLAGEGERVLLAQLPEGMHSLPPDLPRQLEPDPLPPGVAFDPAAALPPSLSDAQGAELLAYLRQKGLALRYGRIEAPPRNALRDELSDFLSAVRASSLGTPEAPSGAIGRATDEPLPTSSASAPARGSTAEPRGRFGASGEDGLRALALAEEVRRGVHASLERLSQDG